MRTDPEALDFSTVLEVILAAPAFVELAKGVANWLSRGRPTRGVTAITSRKRIFVYFAGRTTTIRPASRDSDFHAGAQFR